MSPVIKVSSVADSFPMTEAAYDDLLSLRYRVDGRGNDGTIDCLGCVLEMYHRAGLQLPDPKTNGATYFDFAELFEEITEPDQLYDVISLHAASQHILVVVRGGIALSATAKVGVYTRPVNRIRQRSGVQFFRLRQDAYPPEHPRTLYPEPAGGFAEADTVATIPVTAEVAVATADAPTAPRPSIPMQPAAAAATATADLSATIPVTAGAAVAVAAGDTATAST